MKVLSPINENTDIVDKKYVDDAVSGVQTQVSAKKYWADIEVSGSSSKTSAPTFSPDFKFNVASNSVIGAAANKAIASPLAKYLWHDILSFGVNGHPTVSVSSDGGSTWAASTDETLQKKLFIQREDQTVTVLDDTKTAIRWQWYSTQFHACQASYLNIGFAYSAKQATFNILWETSTDGSTWTTGFKVDGAKYTSSPYWFYLTTNWSNAYWARLTITRTSEAGTSANISGIKLLTPRWGNQGRGGEYEKPYSWDYLQNIFPRANNSATLGTSTAKWKNVYATTFTGDLTGTANKATNDADGNKISTTYLKSAVLSDYYLKTEVNQALADLKSEILGEGIDEAYDTLKELSELISANQGTLSAIGTLIDGKLDKTTYEFNKELNLGSLGKVCIGKFPMYDSNITVTINSTTNTTYHGVLVIATQNINTSLGGTYKAVVYGDASNTLTSAIKIQYLNGSNVFSVYIDLPTYSKNLLHIQCSALKAAPTDIATTVTSIPSTATIVATNALTTNFASKAVATTTTDGLMSAADKTKLTNLSKSDVGLSNVDNTADADKDVHSAWRAKGLNTGSGIETPNGTIPPNLDYACIQIGVLGTYVNGPHVKFGLYAESNIPTIVSGSGIYIGTKANTASIAINSNGAIDMNYNLKVNGSVTATSFIGPFTGDVEGNAATASYATSAGSLTSKSIGGSTTPVYFDADGKPVACTAYADASVNYAAEAGKAAELVTAKKISLTASDASNAHIQFGRAGYNYISFPSSGKLAFGTSATGAGITASVDASSFSPYTTNTKSLGTSSLKWSAVYATTFVGAWGGDAIPNDKLANSKVTVAGKDISLGGSLSAADLKTALGLGNVSNTAASGYLTALTSNTTNAVSITVGGTTKNIAASTMKTSLGLGSLAYLSSLPANSITQGYLNTHPENAPIILPFINNDLAFLNKKGGSYKVYQTTSTDYTAASLTETAVTLNSGDNLFDGSPSYATISTTGAFVAVIDMTLHKVFSYSNVFYIDFGSAQWRAKKVSVYVMNADTETAYTFKQSIEDNAKGNWFASVSHTSVNSAGTTVYGFNRLRVVLSDFYNTSSTSGKRIAQVGLLNYGSYGVTETYVSRGGCAGIYGSLVPHTTNSINLGSSSKKWANVYATTFTGALSGKATSAGTADSATYATSAGDAATLDGIDSTGFLRDMTQNSVWSSADAIPFNLTPGIHRIHISGVEYSSILAGNDYTGAQWQLYFHPHASYASSIKYRYSGATDWKTLLDSSNYSSYALPLTGGTLAGTSQNTPLTIKGTASGNDAWIAFHNNSGFLASLGVSADKKLKLYTNSTSYNVWTAANQGSGSGLDADKLDGLEASAFAQTSALASYLALDGSSTMTGAIKIAETKGILLRHLNATYTAGIGYDTQGNECIAMWAKNSVTRLRWHAGTDMSSTTYQQMMSITPDFEISKADGTAKGYIGGSAIVTAANISSYIPSGGGSTADLSNYVVKNGTGVQCIGGGLVVGSTSTTTAAAAGRVMITGHTNPLIGLIATGSSTPFYFQVSSDIVYLGPTSSVALSLDGSGNTTVRGTFTSVGSITGSLVNGITVFGKKYNNASEITVADTDLVSSVTEGTSDCTDSTEFLTSWASDNGFNDTNGKNKLYRRKMSKVYNYIKGKLDSVYLGKTANAVNGTFYGVCDTAEATVAKTVTISGFPSTLTAGIQVTIKFTNKSGVASATLNVNGTGAKPIYRYGTTAVSTGTTTSGWVAGAVQTFTYDGTGWVREYWNNTTYSNVALGQGYATCSTAAATTAKTAALSSYALTANGIVAIKFTYDVPAGATLNINSKGAKAMYHRGAAITAGVIKAGDTATFIYNTYYHLISIDSVSSGSVSGDIDVNDIQCDNLNATYDITLNHASVVTAYSDNNTNSVMTLRSDTYYKIGTLSSLTVKFSHAYGSSSYLANYMFEFTASSSGCSLTMPSGVKWKDGVAPTIQAGKTYQVSVVNNLAVAAMFS